MRVTRFFAYIALAVSTANALSIPEVDALDPSAGVLINAPRSDILSPAKALEKRKGGGGGGGGKGGGGGGGGGKGGGGGGGGGAPSRVSPSSNVGGSTRAGSGPTRAYGGYYGGGAAVPFGSGQKSHRGLSPAALLLPAAALAIFPGIWLWSVYPYHLNPYSFYNESARRNETLNATCLCQQFASCGCDNNDDPNYLKAAIGNGSYAALNRTLINVADINGTRMLAINGTLPNGTTAPGGTDDAAAGLHINRYAGYWVMFMIVLSTVSLL